MSEWPLPSLRHLNRLADDIGLVEHARFDAPRCDLGYCTDDAGRALAIASKLPADAAAHRLATVTLRFLERAYNGHGVFRIRLSPDGTWVNGSSDDASGRAVLGLGTAAVTAPWHEIVAASRRLFDDAVAFRSEHPRALAYAVLGAAVVLDVIPDHRGARQLIGDAADLLPPPCPDGRWPWPELRLTYANAILPDAMLTTAVALGREPMAHQALTLLEWLVHEESLNSWFSFTPVSGRGPGDEKPKFDQQPLEAWAMADACARAYAHTRDVRWATSARQAATWFVGANDVGVPMFDPLTDGGFDGLERDGVNRNQGAESTLAFVGTMVAAATVERPRLGVPSAIRRRATEPRLWTGLRGDG
jgi:hypothetical protein